MNISDSKEQLPHHRALGLIETRGFVGAVEAADAMLKAAKVKLRGYELSTGALVVVKVTGEVGAVRSAVSAGAEAAKKVGELISTHIIPRPHDETEDIIFPSESVPGEDHPLNFSNLTVPELRTLARRIPSIGMSGREISSAKRDTLVEALEKAQKEGFICRFPE
ncbi:BMC domain-containing protein [bacterium]|nr:BMC domain-containing protein [FCB group bacterium]MBL7192249.1 BMC domain-containing protein [bacterium]